MVTKTYCPLFTLITWVGEISGKMPGVEDADKCQGPACQWWPKCRQGNQCPKCGQAGAASLNVWACPEHGRFDSWGDFLPTEDKPKEKEANE